MIREVKEETGVDVDTNRPVFHLGGFQSQLSRWSGISDRYTALACYAKAGSTLKIIDQKEVLHVKWVPVEVLQKAVVVLHKMEEDAATAFAKTGVRTSPFERKVVVSDAAGGTIEFGYLAVMWYANWIDSQRPPRPVKCADYLNTRTNKEVIMSLL